MSKNIENHEEPEVQIGPRYLCPECQTNDAFTPLAESFTEVITGGYRSLHRQPVYTLWCNECRGADAFYCDYSDEYFSGTQFSSRTTEDSGITFCYEVARVHFHCSDVDDQWYEDADEMPENRRSRIQEYHSGHRPWYGRSFSKEHLGVELEVELEDPCEVAEWVEGHKTHWLCETDGSLSQSHGVEIIAPPLTYPEVMDQWGPLLRQLRRWDAWTPGNAGMHVSMDREAVGDDCTRAMGVLVHRYQKWFKKFTGRDSTYGTYDRRVRWSTDLGHMSHGAYTTSKDYRIEWRIFPSVISDDSFDAHLQLVRACLRFAETTPHSLFQGNQLLPLARAWRQFLTVHAKDDYPALLEHGERQGMVDGHGRFIPVNPRTPRS